MDARLVPAQALAMSLPALLRDLIDAKAAFAGLPVWRSQRYARTFLAGEWLEGLIVTESSGNPKARRYEAHQDRATRRDAPADPDTADVDDGELEDDASYGLCQVMGYNIRALCGGVKLTLLPTAPGDVEVARASPTDPLAFWAPMNFGFAFLPDTNITLGIRVLLAELRAVNGDVEAALARYNGGPTGDDMRPEYGMDMRLRKYVDKVAANTVRVVADRARETP